MCEIHFQHRIFSIFNRFTVVGTQSHCKSRNTWGEGIHIHAYTDLILCFLLERGSIPGDCPKFFEEETLSRKEHCLQLQELGKSRHNHSYSFILIFSIAVSQLVIRLLLDCE